MPTVFRWKGHRFFWYAADGGEPAHVHVFKDGRECKLWLADVSIAFNRGYSVKQIRALIAQTLKERDRLLEIWNEQFGR